MRQALLLERAYTPYSKWLGTAFARLPCAPELAPPLNRALAAATHPDRETALVDAYELLGALRLAPTVSLDTSARFFYDRPFRVLGAGRFVEACLDALHDSGLRQLPLVGSVDQFADSTDVLARAVLLGVIYQPAD
jgi:hypothetical protein